MIRNWYDPVTRGEKIKRSFSVLNLGVMVLTLVLVASEFRFDWVETLAGRYLMSTNHVRPEIGAIWETGHHAVNAHQSLNRIILKKEIARKAVRESDSFVSLAKGLGAGEWANLDKDQFKILYLGLSREDRRWIMEPARLVWLLNGNLTDRIFCEGRVGGIKIYFIDSGNRVIEQIDLDTGNIGEAGPENDLSSASLDTFQGFSGRIYPADRFFNAVFQLPPDVLPDLVRDAETLLNHSGTIDRVGIWNTSEDGYIRLGFEFSLLGEKQVVQVRAREWAVWQLGLVLKGDAPVFGEEDR